jgi:hypothetical protein
MSLEKVEELEEIVKRLEEMKKKKDLGEKLQALSRMS